MLVETGVLVRWRNAGREAFLRGEPRDWNPALMTRAMDGHEARLEKRRAWWRGWDNASDKVTFGVEPPTLESLLARSSLRVAPR
jgi:hypothetical protein